MKRKKIVNMIDIISNCIFAMLIQRLGQSVYCTGFANIPRTSLTVSLSSIVAAFGMVGNFI